MDILVTDGNQRSTLAVTRSLGRRHIRVIVGETRLRSLAGSSRYCWQEFKYPSPLLNPTAFQTALLEYAQKSTPIIILPTTDVTCSLVAGVREHFPAEVIVALPDRDSYELASRKDHLTRLASKHEVPAPHTVFVDDLSNLPEISANLTYPVVIKPCQSKILTARGWEVGGVEYAHSPEELVDKYRRIHQCIPYPLIQERIVGPGCGIFVLYANNRTLAMFSHRRIREKPPSGGVSVLRESIPVEAPLREHSEKILSALNWNGVAMVEYKIDQRDGLPKLMEINGRFWGSLQLAIDAGIDFPYLLYQQLTGEQVSPVDSYQTGVQTRWVLGDVDHVLIMLLHARDSLSLPPEHPGRMQTLRDFCRSWGNQTRTEIWRRDDIMPAFREIQDYCASGLRSLWTKIR